MTILDFYDYYTNDLGWKIIPVSSAAKSPIFKQWNINYNKDFYRNYLVNNLDANLGILLGDIIDIEADSYEANVLLTKLTNHIKHPKYRSEKSIHHLFKCHDSNLTRLVVEGIEFRGRNHQSLLPPSKNARGIVYSWSYFCDLPEVPDSVLNFYNEHKNKITSIWEHPVCWSCRKRNKIIKKRYILEKKAFYHHGLRWQCQTCRKIDVKNYCKLLKKSLN